MQASGLGLVVSSRVFQIAKPSGFTSPALGALASRGWPNSDQIDDLSPAWAWSNSVPSTPLANRNPPPKATITAPMTAAHLRSIAMPTTRTSPAELDGSATALSGQSASQDVGRLWDQAIRRATPEATAGRQR